jgi:gliding motility-associated-like protein
MKSSPYQMLIGKVIFSSLLLFFLNLSANGQQLNWMAHAGSAGNEAAQATQVDNAGNVFMCGGFSATTDFDPSASTANLVSNGSTDIFIAKYDAAGQYIWAINIGGAGLDAATAIATDLNGNVYITGYFRGANVDFDPSVSTTLLTSNGDGGGDPGYGGDIFVAKYSPTGQFLWAFNIGGPELYDSGLSIATDVSGSVYVGGFFKFAADFDPSPAAFPLNSANGTAFLAKYDPNGLFQWAFNIGLGNNDNTVYDIRTDNLSNVYICGFFQGANIDFDPSAGNTLLSSNGAYDAYFAKYNSNGQIQFAKNIGGAGLDVARGIALDFTGNIYITGDFQGANVDFDPAPATTALQSSAGGSDAFVASYDYDGNYRWAFKMGGPGTDLSWKISGDNIHLFVTGNFSGSVDMDPGASTDLLTSSGGFDISVGKYTVAGGYVCSFRTGGSGDDFGLGIQATGANSFYLAGSFTGSGVDFDPGPAVVDLNSAGGDDAFLAKYDWVNVTPEGTLAGAVVCKGQTAQLTFNASQGVGPFTIVYNNGITDITQNNVQSGVPFTVTPSPVTTTTYTLLSIKDALRCSPTKITNSTATLVLNIDSVRIKDSLTACSSFDFKGLGYVNTVPINSWQWSFGDAATASGQQTIHSYTAPGNFDVKLIVTDANGCMDSITRPIIVSPKPVITLTKDTAICHDKPLQLTASGGITYSWTPAATLSDASIANPVATPSATTTYILTITDGNKCPAVDSVKVSIKPLPVFTIGTDSTVCAGTTVQLNAGGGSSYLWSPATSLNDATISNPTANPVTNTIFTVKIKEATCNDSTELSTTITVKALPVVNVQKTNDIDCSFSSAQLTASGAGSYSWSPTTGLSDPLIANPVATPSVTSTYIVTGTTNGCSKSEPITINVNALAGNIDSVKIKDSLTACSSFNFKGLGYVNTAPISSWQWSFGDAGTASGEQTNHTYSSPGNFDVKLVVTDAHGCKDSITRPIVVAPKPVIVLTKDTAICHDKPIQLTASGGTIYSWTPAGTLSNAGIANPIATPSTTTNYILTVTDGSKCSSVDSVKVSIRPLPVFTVGAGKTICAGATVELNASGGNSYWWSPTASLNNATVSNPTANPVTNTIFTVKIKEATCNDSTELSTTILVTAPPAVRVQKANDIDCGLPFAQLTASGADSYRWSPATGLSNLFIANPVATPSVTSTYVVTGTTSGCSASDSITVRVNGSAGKINFNMPGAFTPNDDKKNDCFGLGKFAGLVQEMELSVFNRWGQRVFHSTDPTACWDGRFKGQMQPGGGFLYSLRVKTSCGPIERKGVVVLVR